jgi:hypothetical protein
MPTRYVGPAELTTRVGASDELLVRRLYGLVPGIAPAPHRPARLVVDAHVPLSSGGVGMARVARQAGVPFLVDPETVYLQDVQHSGAPWSKVPFARGAACTPADLIGVSVQQALVKSVIDYQITHGATQLIAPYVHIERPTPGWAQVQAGLWRRTAAYVEQAGVHLPVVAVVALGWRCLHPTRGVPALGDVWTALAALDPAEVAVAASKVHLGARPVERMVELLMLVRNLSSTYKVTMWQQGLLGEACVVEGAAGYECGIGWRDKCDMQSHMGQHRRPSSGHPKRRLELARTKRAIWSRLICPFPDCCSPGGDDLLGDARRHSVIARARGLDQLSATSATRWRWNRLTQRYEEGIDLAARLNALHPSTSAVPGIATSSLYALYEIANARRSRLGVARRTA